MEAEDLEQDYENLESDVEYLNEQELIILNKIRYYDNTLREYQHNENG
jgi:hypothetical protein